MPDLAALIAKYRAAHSRYFNDAYDEDDAWEAARDVIGIATELVDMIEDSGAVALRQTEEPDVSETGPWTCLEDVPQNVLRVTGSDGNLIGRTTDGRWACMDAARYKQTVPLDASGTFTEVIADA